MHPPVVQEVRPQCPLATAPLRSYSGPIYGDDGPFHWKPRWSHCEGTIEPRERESEGGREGGREREREGERERKREGGKKRGRGREREESACV